MKIKYESIKVTRTIGDTGLEDFRFQLDPAYDRIVGMRGYLLVNGDEPYLEVGLKNREETFHNLTPHEDWKPLTGEFYKPVNIEYRGQDFYLQTNVPQAVATADLVFIVVFVLQKGD